MTQKGIAAEAVALFNLAVCRMLFALMFYYTVVHLHTDTCRHGAHTGIPTFSRASSARILFASPGSAALAAL